MTQTKITLFANFFIDNEERFKRLQFSFKSIKQIKFCEYIINIRGSYKNSVTKFLKKYIKKNLHISYLHSSQGWNYDSKKLIKLIKGKYVFQWLEDQVCMINSKHFHFLINDLNKKKIDLINYSLFLNGNNIKSFKNIRLIEQKRYYHLHYDINLHKKRLEYVKKKKIKCHIFIISLPSIFRKKLFKKVINANDPLIKRWPRETPFNIEKGPKDFHWLPFNYALPKQELFNSIDDNGGLKGASLIEKGAYKAISLKRTTYSSNISLVYKITLFILIREIINKIYSIVLTKFKNF